MQRVSRPFFLMRANPKRILEIIDSYKETSLRIPMRMQKFLTSNQSEFETLVNMYHDIVFDMENYTKINLWYSSGFFYKYKDRIIPDVIVPETEKREELLRRLTDCGFIGKVHNFFKFWNRDSNPYVYDESTCSEMYDYVRTKWYTPMKMVYDTIAIQFVSPELLAVADILSRKLEGSTELMKLNRLNSRIIDTFTEMNEQVVRVFELIAT